jgi:hypothetical protein
VSVILKENVRNTGLENMRLVTPSAGVSEKHSKILKSDLPELSPPSQEYIEVYRPVLVKRKQSAAQSKLDGQPTIVPKKFPKPPLHKAYSVDY